MSFGSGTHRGGRIDQGNRLGGFWFGNFKLNDELLDSGYPPNGPITFSFGRKLFAIGSQIQTDYFGPFTAQLCDTNGVCVERNGISNSLDDGSAIFIGLSDRGGFTGATFSVTACVEDCTDFAINQMDIQTTTPEPASWSLLVAGILVACEIQYYRQ